MRLNRKPTKPSSPRTSMSSRPSRRMSAKKEMETFVTLFKRDSIGSSSSGREEDAEDQNVSMSSAGQKVIPATFKMVPIEGEGAITSSDHTDAQFDQAAGHSNSFSQEGNTLVKKAPDREAAFYEAAQAGKWPKNLLPEYFGREGFDSIKIENLTHGLRRPCVLDLKMGVQTVEDDEQNILKKLKMRSLDLVTGSKQVGCRLEGLSMYRTLENTKVKGTKSQSHSISASLRVTLQDVLTFFLTDESGVRTDLAIRFESAVKVIKEQFERNDSYRFIGSSILFIYDNDNRAPYMHWARALRRIHEIEPSVRLREDQLTGLTRRTRCDVRMIDFAHTGPMPEGMVRDEGYIRGLNSILEALGEIRKHRAQPIFSFFNAAVDAMEEHRARGQSRDEGGETDNTFGGLLRQLTPLAKIEEDEEFQEQE